MQNCREILQFGGETFFRSLAPGVSCAKYYGEGSSFVNGSLATGPTAGVGEEVACAGADDAVFAWEYVGQTAEDAGFTPVALGYGACGSAALYGCLNTQGCCLALVEAFGVYSSLIGIFATVTSGIMVLAILGSFYLRRRLLPAGESMLHGDTPPPLGAQQGEQSSFSLLRKDRAMGARVMSRRYYGTVSVFALLVMVALALSPLTANGMISYEANDTPAAAGECNLTDRGGVAIVVIEPPSRPPLVPPEAPPSSPPPVTPPPPSPPPPSPSPPPPSAPPASPPATPPPVTPPPSRPPPLAPPSTPPPSLPPARHRHCCHRHRRPHRRRHHSCLLDAPSQPPSPPTPPGPSPPPPSPSPRPLHRRPPTFALATASLTVTPAALTLAAPAVQPPPATPPPSLPPEPPAAAAAIATTDERDVGRACLLHPAAPGLAHVLGPRRVRAVRGPVLPQCGRPLHEVLPRRPGRDERALAAGVLELYADDR